MDDIFFEVLRGKLKGQTLKVHQMCNDWITANDVNGDPAHGGQPISPTSTYFDAVNRMKVLQMQRDKQLGVMFSMDYDLEHFMITGKFRRLALRGPSEALHESFG